MKKLLLFFIPVFVLSLTTAAQNIVKLEYSVNEFVTEGNGTTVDLPGDSEEVDFNFNIDISNLLPGVHTLFFRTQNEDGVWSFMEKRGFYIPKPIETYQIIAYEYMLTEFDTEGTGEMTILESGTFSVDTTFNIDVSNLDNGVYSIYFRAKNNVGLWSHTEKRTLFIQRPDTTKVDKIHYRFFTDNDDGTWSQTDITPDQLMVDSLFLFNTSGIDTSVPVSLEVYAENTKTARGFSAFVYDFDLTPNSAPTALQTELLAEMNMGTVLDISMDTLFNDINEGNGDQITYSIENPDNVELLNFATWIEEDMLQLAPEAGLIGVFTFDLKATDAFGETAIIPTTITIINNIPSALADEVMVETKMGMVANVEMDTLFADIDVPNGDELTYSIENADAGLMDFLSWAAEGMMIELAPGAGTIGEYNFDLKAEDSFGESVIIPSTVSVLNRAPEALKDGISFELEMGMTGSVSMDTLFTDGDIDFGDALTYTLTNVSDPEMLDFVTWTNDMLIDIVPAVNDVGEYTFDIKAEDINNESVDIPVSLKVINNEPEALSNDISIEMEMGMSMEISMDTLFADDDVAFGDELSYSLENASDPSINNFIMWTSSGMLSISPVEGTVGEYSFDLQAMDISGALVDIPVSVSVINNVPVALEDEINFQLEMGMTASVSMDTLFTDDDIDYGDALSYSLAEDGNSTIPGFVSWASAVVLEVAPGSLSVGSYTFNVEAEDNYGANQTIPFSVEVTNSLPYLLQDEIRMTLLQGNIVNVSMDTLITDDDLSFDDELSFSVVNANIGAVYDFTSWMSDGLLKIAPGTDVSGFHSFDVEAVDLFGGTVLLPFSLTIEETTSVENLNQASFTIYPNPADDVIFIENHLNSADGTLEIIDVQGQIVRSHNLINLSEIDVSDLEGGIYFIKIENDDLIYHQKVIIQ